MLCCGLHCVVILLQYYKAHLTTLEMTNHSHVFEPEFIDLKTAEGRHRYEELLNTPGVQVFDEIEGQLVELFKIRNVKKNPKEHSEDYDLFKKEHLNGSKLKEYGLWVYYDWSRSLIHLIPEDEFIEIRTSRNKYKITGSEQDLLRTKCVGIVGLSVGQSVALTIAMERVAGKLRLADFDTLELSNYNRIRTPLKNLGLPKVIAVAREIYEIDPFLNIEIFPEGLTKHNIDQFFDFKEPLDLIIDECDSIDIKYLLRFEAKKRRIPVLMEMSDRCMIDIERFDLEPDRPVLHGLVGDVDMNKLSMLQTSEEKIPYLIPMLGLETLSTRLRASALEIGQSIGTWPQLASAVAMGGGITADLCRRIFLNELKDSGRAYVDLEDIFPEKLLFQKLLSVATSKTEDIINRLSNQNEQKLIYLEKDLVEIIRAACHAPSGGNLQPWKWKVASDSLQLFVDKSCTSSFLDFKGIATYIALGASIENAVIKAKGLGYTVDFNYCSDFMHIADIKLMNDEFDVSPEDKILAESLFERHTNRNIESDIINLNEIERAALKNVLVHDNELILIEQRDELMKLAEIISGTEHLRLLNTEGHQNFVEEMRWSASEAEQTGDGIDIRTLDLKDSEKIGIRISKDPNVIKHLREWDLGLTFREISYKTATHSSAIGIICRKSVQTSQDLMQVGRDMERVWIKANAIGLRFQPQSPITLIKNQLENPNSSLTKSEQEKLQGYYKELCEFVSSKINAEPVFLFRLFKSQREAVKSYRKPLTEKFFFH